MDQERIALQQVMSEKKQPAKGKKKNTKKVRQDDEEDETDGAGEDSADQKAVGADKAENEGMQSSL